MATRPVTTPTSASRPATTSTTLTRPVATSTTTTRPAAVKTAVASDLVKQVTTIRAAQTQIAAASDPVEKAQLVRELGTTAAKLQTVLAVAKAMQSKPPLTVVSKVPENLLKARLSVVTNQITEAAAARDMTLLAQLHVRKALLDQGLDARTVDPTTSETPTSDAAPLTAEELVTDPTTVEQLVIEAEAEHADLLTSTPEDTPEDTGEASSGNTLYWIIGGATLGLAAILFLRRK